MKNRKIRLILIISFLAYSNTFFNSFLWDDKEMIVKNREIKSLKNIPGFFVPQPDEPYRPLRKVLYSVNYFFFGLRPGLYHMVNAGLHTANVLMFYLVVLLIFKNKGMALLAALIFGVNPAWNEAVVWIKNCAGLLAALLFLLAFYFYVKKKLRLSLLFFITALFTKEIALTFPLIIALYTLIFEGKKQLKKVIPFCLISAGFFIFLWIIYKGGGAGDISPGAGIFLGFKVFFRYFLILIWPFYLNAERQVFFSKYIFDFQVISGFFLVIAAIYAVLKSRKKEIIFSFFWLSLNLFPVLNPAIVAGRPLAEHRLYIAGMGFSLFLAFILQGRKKFLYFLIVLFFVTSFRRNFVWKNPLSFWTKAVSSSSGSTRAWGNLGFVYKEKGEFALAEKHYKKAIELDPKNDNATHGLIEIYTKTDRLEEARELIDEFTKIRPAIIKTRYQLAEVYKKDGKLEGAIKVLEKIIMLYPGEAAAYNELGIIYFQSGMKEKAKSILSKAIKIKPDYSASYSNLATILHKEGDCFAAIEYYKKALKVNPALSEAYCNLANTLDDAGKREEAIENYRKAVRISPDYSDAWYNLGFILMKERNYKEAAECFKQVMELEPENEEVRNKYEEARNRI